jgi:hypothetical protein
MSVLKGPAVVDSRGLSSESGGAGRCRSRHCEAGIGAWQRSRPVEVRASAAVSGKQQTKASQYQQSHSFFEIALQWVILFQL